jgi:hypothetical protein
MIELARHAPAMTNLHERNVGRNLTCGHPDGLMIGRRMHPADPRKFVKRLINSISIRRVNHELTNG